MGTAANFGLKKWKDAVDWRLLMFLLLFLNVKLAVKIPALAVIYLLQFDFKFGFKLKNSRLPLFYLMMLPLSLLSFLFNKSYQNPNYLPVLLTGLLFWLLCILAVHQVKLSVEKNSTEIIHQTLLVFFVINVLLSAFNLLTIIWETGAVNPYIYQGQYQKYFIGTGDYIKGITFDISTTNAIINAMGVLYFLTRKKPVFLLICMATLLLTGSNFVNIILLLILSCIFLLNSSRDQKSMILICFVFLVVCMVKISPQNNRYVAETFKNILNKGAIHHDAPSAVSIPIAQRPDSLLSSEEKKIRIATLYLDSLRKSKYLKEKKELQTTSNTSITKTDEGRIIVSAADINSAPYQSRKVPLTPQYPLIQFIYRHKQFLPVSGHLIKIPALPGKVLALLQTLKFYKKHPGKIVLGNGIGNFSSKLAFRTTGLGFSGGFPKKHLYISPDFMSNHLDLYLNFFSKQSGYHSLTNSPFSVYDQILAEYGLLGSLIFAFYYLGFFAKHYKTLTYGIPLLALIMAIFFVDYWFEQLSVLVLFELMLFLNIKETSLIISGGHPHD